MTKQDLKKIDGNSLDDIGRFLNVKFNRECYERFEELRTSYPRANKIIGIAANMFNMTGYNVWLHGLHDIEDDAILVANGRTNLSRKWPMKDVKEVYCAYDKQGNYIGGLESYLG